MRLKTILLPAFFSAITFATLSQTGWKYNSTGTDNKTASQKKPAVPTIAAKYMNGMQFIAGGSFTMGNAPIHIVPAEGDSTLLVASVPRRVTVSSFYICDHEVTNAEYREFTTWVKDSICLSMLAAKDPDDYLDKEKKYLDWSKRSAVNDTNNAALFDRLYFPRSERYYGKKLLDTDKLIYSNGSLSVGVYPDTLRWVRDFAYSYNEPMTNMYFWHPAYDNYPVVGVSYDQANAFCQWKTEQLNKAISKYNAANKGKNPLSYYPNFRLPTEAEWEYAALAPLPSKDPERIAERPIYPWPSDKLMDEKGNYRANFGAIRDRNNLMTKEYAEGTSGKDGSGFHTTHVKSFPANNFKLYDMAGNVAEWNMDVARVGETNENTVTTEDNFESALKKVTKQYEADGRKGGYEIEQLKALTKLAMHNAKALAKNKDGRIVKGGSWANGPAYMLCSGREVFLQNKSSCRIGFRIAMTVPGEL